MSFDLPRGWTTAALQDLVAPAGLMTDGDWVESKDQDPEGGVRLLQLADIGAGQFRDRSRRFLSAQKAAELNCTYLQPGDLLIARLGDVLGKACLAPALSEPAVTVVDVHVFRSGHPDVSHQWLMHFLNSLGTQRALEQISSGTTRKRVTGNKLKGFEVPLPPALEQRRIVSRIEELFSEIDAGERALERVQTLVERYRQSVLKAAVTGELASSVRTALPAGQTDHEDQPTLPGGWRWVRLADLVNHFGNGLSRKPDSSPPGMPILRISAVRPLAVNAADVRYYQPQGDERLDNFWVCDGDILWTRYNGSRELVGVSGVYRSKEPALHPDKLIKARVSDPSVVLADYLAIALNAGATWRYLTSCVKTSAGQHGIAGADIKRAPIPLPPIEEQRRIVETWHAADALVTRAREAVQAQQQRSAALRQSILAAAFSGRLVPQDPSDEPASALLARLAEQAAASPGAPTRRGRRAASA